MNEKDYLLLKTLEKERTLSRAAEKLYLSQPALSYRLQTLEKETGAKLLNRSRRGATLTPAGEFLLIKLAQLNRELQQTREQIRAMSGSIAGILRLGISSVFAHYDLPMLMKSFHEKYPEVEFQVKTGVSAQIQRMLQEGEIHIGILRTDYGWAGNRTLLKTEPICLAASKPLTFEELPHYPQIRYATDGALQTLIDHWWAERFSSPPRTAMEVDSMDTCRELVRAGLGWAILPAIGLQGQVAYQQPLFNHQNQPLQRCTWLMIEPMAENLPSAQAFQKFLISHFNSTNSPEQNN